MIKVNVRLGDFSESFNCTEFLFVCFELESHSVAQARECHAAILAHCNLHLPDSSNSLASASQVAEITGTHYHAQLFFVEMRFHHIGQAGLELLISGDSPASAS